MSRGLTWAATSVPEIRRQWCNALDATAERHSEPLLDRTDAGKNAAAIEVMKVAVAARRSAELYWVARNMVEAAVGASSTLPGCYVTGLAKSQSLSVA